MFYDETVVNIRNNVNQFKVKISNNINEIFINKIIKEVKEGDKILDIGTGNGFVLKEVKKRCLDKKIELIGVDNSESMIEALGNTQDIKTVISDNYHLPFRDELFEIITAKNVTRFLAKEIYRILKHGGKFIYREYGKYKGLVEISKLFEGRLIRARESRYYNYLLQNFGFKDIEIFKYLISREFETIEDVLKVVRSFPYILNYSSNDEAIIKHYLKEAKDGLVIHSDPFILIGGK